MGIEIGALLKNSWETYKALFKTNVTIGAILYLVPQVVLIFFVLMMIGAFAYFGVLRPAPENYVFIGLAIAIGVLFFLAYIVVSTWYSASLISATKKKGTAKDAMREGAKYIWKVILLSLLLSLIYLGIALVVFGPAVLVWALYGGGFSWKLVLPLLVTFLSVAAGTVIYIALSTYWVFAGFTIVCDNARVTESLRRSYELVRGRWWLVFAYMLIMVAVLFTISMSFSLVRVTIQLPFSLFSFVGAEWISTTVGIILAFVEMALWIAITPIGIVMIKQLYDAAKKNAVR